MSVVSFTDYRPSPRFDEVPWNRARIEESTEPAPYDWQEVETLELDPVDPDPAHPAERSFTTTQADETALAYRVVFLDEFGGSQGTSPVLPESDLERAWRPAVIEVAALVPTRTKDQNGNYLGTFTDQTRPTRDDVEATIDLACVDVLSHFVAGDVPEQSWDEAKRAAARAAAADIEGTYFPEQAETQSPYANLRAQADAAMKALIAVAQARDGFQETEPEPVV